MVTVIDSHTHIYPSPIAQKAVASIQEFYDFPIQMDGQVQTLLDASHKAGISRSVIHSVAISPGRVSHINDFLLAEARQHKDRFIPFGSMHPGLETIESELDRIIAAGAKGVKIHPDIQQFLLDSPESIHMFRAIADRNIPALVHTGDTRYPYSHPERLARLMDAIPSLTVIAAHFGGWSMWKEGCCHLAGREHLWVDTSSSLYALTPQEAVEIIHQYGVKQVLFATDYPMWNPVEEIKRFLALPLSPTEQEQILHINAETLLKPERETIG